MADFADTPRSIALATRIGREIPNEQIPEMAPVVVARLQKIFRSRYPALRERRPPSGLYNCHGLTFANRRTGIYDPQLIELLLQDDGFRKIGLRQVEPVDLVVYYDEGEVSHTGIVLEVIEGEPPSLRVARLVSKWGQAGEFIHTVTEGEYREHAVTYWTDRP